MSLEGESSGHDPRFAGVSLRLCSLGILTLQNSALTTVMHYSRVMPMADVNEGRYFSTTAVFLNEIIKLVISMAMIVREKRRASEKWHVADVIGDIFEKDWWKLTIPAAMYTMQNNLQYVAISSLSAAEFQVTYQLKILTTALFSVILLHRSLSWTRWVSLVLLTIGVAIVQLPGVTEEAPKKAMWDPTRLLPSHPMAPSPLDNKRLVGLIAVCVSCILSGLAGVYFEKVLKGSSTMLWVRNVQMCIPATILAGVVGVGMKDGEEISHRGFFSGYNSVVWIAILLQALGGLVVAFCVKFADNISKNFATSISIILSLLISTVFFDFRVTPNVRCVRGQLTFSFSLDLFSYCLLHGFIRCRIDRAHGRRSSQSRMQRRTSRSMHRTFRGMVKGAIMYMKQTVSSGKTWIVSFADGSHPPNGI